MAIVYGTFHVHRKRAGQMVDLLLALGAEIALEAPTDIEVIQDEIHVEAVKSAEAAIPVAAVESLGGDVPEPASNGETAGTAPGTIDAEGQDSVLIVEPVLDTMVDASADVPHETTAAPDVAVIESEVIHEQGLRDGGAEIGAGNGDEGSADVAGNGQQESVNADENGKLAGSAGEVSAGESVERDADGKVLSGGDGDSGRV